MEASLLLVSMLAVSSVWGSKLCKTTADGFDDIKRRLEQRHRIEEISKENFFYTSRGVGIIYVTLRGTKRVTIVRQNVTEQFMRQEFDERHLLLQTLSSQENFAYRVACFIDEKFGYFYFKDRKEYITLFNHPDFIGRTDLLRKLYENIALKIDYYQTMGFSPIMESILHFRVPKDDMTQPIDLTVDKLFRIGRDACIRPFYLAFPDFFPNLAGTFQGTELMYKGRRFECLNVKKEYNHLIAVSLIYSLDYFQPGSIAFKKKLEEHIKAIDVETLQNFQGVGQLLQLIEANLPYQLASGTEVKNA